MILREYFLKSTFLGLHFIAEKRLHWTERVFWFVCVCGCWFASVYLMVTTLEFYSQTPTTLVENTNYLSWGTKLPSVIVCESNSKKLDDEIDRIFPDKSNVHRGRTNMQQLVFFAGRLTENKLYYYPGNMSYYKSLRSKCEEIFNYCLLTGKEIECCKSFLPVETVWGVCFAINNQHANLSKPIKKIYIGVGHDTNELTLEFLNPNVIIYVISPDELPTYKTSAAVKSTANYAYRVVLKIGELVNEAHVKDLSIKQRNCRFIYENNLVVSKLYSYDSCRLQCQKNVHMSLYNCTHHYMPYAKEEEICNDTQLIKLSQEYKFWTNEQKFECNCYSSCYGYEVNVLASLKYKLIKENSLSHVVLSVSPQYTKKIRRRSRNNLDIIVSLGGTAGLFVGASLLSVVEIIYYFTIRAANNKIISHQTKKHKRSRFLPFVH